VVFSTAQPLQNKKYKLKQEQYPSLVVQKRAYSYLFIFFTVLFLLLFFSFSFAAHVNNETNPKFLIIHLDALASERFFQYMEEDYFPNIKTVFKEGHIIPYGLSLYPGGTETIIPRLQEGIDASKGGVSSGGYYDREKDKRFPQYKEYYKLLFHIPRRARAGFIYGIPWFDSFMFLPMSNIPKLLEAYDIIQFYWFTTDAFAHLFGEEQYLSSFKRFDHYFGKLVSRLNLDEINLIVYVDHGMSFGEFIDTPQSEEISRIAGDNFKVYIHPNIYLKNPVKKAQLAQELVRETDIDFAFYQENNYRVIGYSARSKMIFEGNNEKKIRYLYEGEDVFAYYDDGYKGEWLDASEWLSFTRDNHLPAVPPNIYTLLMNEKAGDIVIVINPPKIPIFKLPYPANHAGLTKTDLLVPIMLRGKELEHLYSIEEIWLHTLFTSIPTLNFANIEPKRESNTFSFWGSVSEEYSPGFELSLSPAYRWNIALRYEQEIYKGWFEYDIYSSYVIRLWTGAGLQYQYEENNFEPFFNARLQMDFGKIQFNYGGQVNFNNLKDWQENRKEIIYRINNRLSFNWQIPNRFGFTLHW
jgi:hypothetical protein